MSQLDESKMSSCKAGSGLVLRISSDPSTPETLIGRLNETTSAAKRRVSYLEQITSPPG